MSLKFNKLKNSSSNMSNLTKVTFNTEKSYVKNHIRPNKLSKSLEDLMRTRSSVSNCSNLYIKSEQLNRLQKRCESQAQVAPFGTFTSFKAASKSLEF